MIASPGSIAFTIGPLEVRWYGIMITLAVVAAIAIAVLEARRRGEVTEHILKLALVVIPLGIIGARLYHVIDQWDFYSRHPALIFRGQGFGIFGALIGGTIGLIIYTRWQKLNTWRWLDIAAPGIILAQAIGRWGNFFNQELYGYPTNLPWGIYIDPAHRLPEYEAFSHFHPLFLYEFLWNLIGFSLLMVLGRKLQRRLMDGELFGGYIVYYSVGRFILEGLKPDVWAIAGFPTARWVASIAIVAAIGVMVFRRYRFKRKAAP